ncbi:hypothetical protein [Paracoccus sanguinis]|uniref:hypothetical protein n=1 Tax=Paracoccus sanguinis TaxID=1545044 RepID=UPI00145297DD|nr:hypothetical protein [Paracoccus sanguinis]QJD16566.1 hypothetical protein HGN31_06460 [Paracoccus sanguinis]
MREDEAQAVVERQRSRKCHVDPVHAAVAPTFFAMTGFSALQVWGIATIAWWGIVLAGVAVFGGVWLHTKQMNESMRHEVEQLMRRDAPFGRLL